MVKTKKRKKRKVERQKGWNNKFAEYGHKSTNTKCLEDKRKQE